MPKKPAKKQYVPKRRKYTGKWQKMIIAMSVGASKHFPKKMHYTAYRAFYNSAKNMGRNPAMEADGNGGWTIILDAKEVLP